MTSVLNRTGRVWFGASLALSMSMSPFVVYGIAVLAPFIIDDLGLSRTSIGSLTSITFAVAALTGPFVGRLVDVIGGRRVVGMLFLAGVASLATLGVAPGYELLVAGSLLSGLAQGAANPSTNHLIRAAISPGQRGLLVGVKQSGVKIGQLIASATLPSLAVPLGWRMAFLTSSGAAAIVGAVATVILPAHHARPRGGKAKRGRGALPAFLPALVLYGFLMGMPQAAVATYMPLYAFERLDFTPATAGVVAGLIGFVGMVSRMVWGRAAERLQSISGPLMLIAMGALVSMLLILTAQFGLPNLVWIGAVLFAATAPVWNVIGMLAVIGGTSGEATGRASGLVMTGFSTGFIVGPILFGLSVDVTGDYQVGWTGAALCMLVAATLASRSRRLSAAGLA